MSKTTYIICGINMAASAIALFLIFRSPTKPKIIPPPPLPVASAPAETPTETWSKFEQSTGMQAAALILGKLPATDEVLDKIKTFVEAQNVTTQRPADFAVINRTGAALDYLGSHCQWNSSHFALLQVTAKNRQNPVILRDLALRAVVNTALRQQTIKDDPDTGWRAELSDFLLQSEFGTETSIAGLALQAALFAQNQGILTLDKNILASKLGPILENHATVQENTLLAAIELSPQTPDEHLTALLRTIIRQPRSEAVLLMSISSLAKIGTQEDLRQIAAIRTDSAAAYTTVEAAWRSLPSRAALP